MLLLVATGANAADNATVSDATEKLANLQLRYDAAMAGGTYVEASAAAAQYISILLQDPDYDRIVWANALLRLADAQQAARQTDSAIENYLLSADTFGAENDRLDASLVQPLLGAGTALVTARRYEEAITVLERTLHLQQVNDGLHDLAQTETLHQLSVAYYKLGDFRRALGRQQASTSIHHSNYPGNDVRKVPAMLAEAKMLMNTGALIDSHTAYRRTVDLIENAEGRRSPLLLPAFNELSYLLTRYRINDGYDGAQLARRYLQRGIHIVEKNPDIDPVLRADAYISMGDYMATQTFDRASALRRYQTAWRILTEEDLMAARDDRFGEALLINGIPQKTVPDMLNLLNRIEEREQTEGRRVSARFQVNKEGLPQNIEIVQADPDGYWARLAFEHIENFIYRPKLVDGEPEVDPNHYWETIYELDAGDDF